MLSRRGGIRSSVNGTLGSIEMIDLVKKSSGGIEAAVRFEMVFAADLSARSDAVKFDLNADFFLGLGSSSTGSLSESAKTLKSNSSTSTSMSDKGCSVTFSVGGEKIGSCFLAGLMRLARNCGVRGKPSEGEASDPELLSTRDGVDSVEVVLYDGEPLSLSASSISSSSSGGLRRRSNGVFSSDELYSESEL